MLILVIDPSGLTLDWCLRCIAAGHTVKLYTKGSRAKHIGEGLVDKVDNWRPYVRVADLIFSADNLEFMDEIQNLIDEGYPVYGPGKKAAKLELDRMYGQNVIKAFGGPIIPSHEFKNYDAAIKFVKENPKRYVCKPCGEEEDKTLSYVAKDEADLIGFLTKRKESGKGGSPYFILQEFKAGTEIACTGIFGPAGWMDFWFEGWEFKKQMNGDLGVNTGEMGTVIRTTKESKIAEILMKPMEKELKKIGYVGMLDMNCIIDEKDGTPWPMEWTARPGYPMWNIMQPLMEGDPAEWMLDCVKGHNTLKVKYETCVGVVMANGDFPFNKREEEDYLDFPVLTDDIPPENLHPCEMKLSKTMKMIDGELCENIPELGTAGSYILVLTGTGKTISESKDMAYKHVKMVKLGNDPQYRTDIGERCEKGVQKIKKHGYCTDWKY